MLTAALALLTGTVCGAVFALVKLPIPAPPTIAGLLGVVGVWAGFALITLWRN
jgi:XapX domain-containing protein